MDDLDVQSGYWDGVAASKIFTHPIPLSVFHDLFPLDAKILDYGCGYGRTCSELIDAGYRNVIGIDISEEMIKRGRHLNDRLDLRNFDGRSAAFNDRSFDVCLLMAVLTCVPSDAGQAHTIDEIHRLLRPGGFIFVSDYPLQSDTRNQKRYKEFEKELGTFGLFCTEGAVVRHHDMQRIHQLLSPFNILRQEHIRVCTMNGHESDVFQIVAQKRNGD
jgi:SAM-dependent methyltransferase